jgi:hypothetical protein
MAYIHSKNTFIHFNTPNLSQPWPWARNQGKGLQGWGPRGKPKSARMCEGIDPHTPGGLSNFQSAITEVKTHRIEQFFISLESYWNLDV